MDDNEVSSPSSIFSKQSLQPEVSSAIAPSSTFESHSSSDNDDDDEHEHHHHHHRSHRHQGDDQHQHQHQHQHPVVMRLDQQYNLQEYSSTTTLGVADDLPESATTAVMETKSDNLPQPTIISTYPMKEKVPDNPAIKGQPPEPPVDRTDYWLTVWYISLFSYFGCVLRLFMARAFGLDCERKGTDTFEDFLTPLFEQICITATGKTNQRGGALFIDLPANMLGCFIIGMLSPPANVANHPIPWFPVDHPLQKFQAFPQAIKVGLCGSLTTFASWNTQMIIMMDGTNTELGSQVPAALFGYLLGVVACIATYILGKYTQEWLRSRQQPSIEPSCSTITDLETGSFADAHNKKPAVVSTSQPYWDQFKASIFGMRNGSVLLCVGLTAAFLYGDAAEHIAFYRQLWLSLIFGPIGSLLRWKLTAWNHANQWPMGTLAANLLASNIAALMAGLNAIYHLDENTATDNQWSAQLWLMTQLGFCGSLSTVSTLIKEVVDSKQVSYCLATLGAGMILGLAIYSPLVRLS